MVYSLLASKESESVSMEYIALGVISSLGLRFPILK